MFLKLTTEIRRLLLVYCQRTRDCVKYLLKRSFYTCINIHMAHTVSLATGKAFHIMGIIHRDKDNGRIIGDWLNTIRPHVITLEFSPYGLMFRKEKGPAYREKVESIFSQMKQDGEVLNDEAVSFLHAYIDLPSEYEAASLYCNENGTSLHLVDMDLFSYMKLKNADELFSEKNIRNIIGTTGGHAGAHERVLARLFFDSGIQTTPYTEEMLIRDRYMGRRIGTLLQDHKDQRITHITGWQHLKDPYNVFTPFHPIKVFPYV
jgi:hypothetical protein